MNTQNYPSWLVPLEIAKELKEIGFHELVQNSYYSNKGTERILSSTLRLEKKSLADANILNFLVSLPTWEQVFEWLREKGYIGTINFVYIDKNNFYYKLRINGKCNFIDEEKFTNYEDAREKLINKLIETYKTNEFL